MPPQTRDLLKVDEDSFPYIFEENVTVPLKSSDGLVRVNVYRPKTQEKVPVLVTYGPYGKDIPYEESVLPTVLWRNPPSIRGRTTNTSNQLPHQIVFGTESGAEI